MGQLPVYDGCCGSAPSSSRVPATNHFCNYYLAPDWRGMDSALLANSCAEPGGATGIKDLKTPQGRWTADKTVAFTAYRNLNVVGLLC